MSFLSDIFGSKPKVPQLGKVDTGKSQMDAIAGNIAAEPQAAKLADLTREQLEKMLTATMGPDWQNTRNQIGQNIYEESQGIIPKGVSDAVRRNAAGQALTGGYAGSGMSRNLEARDLGLTSLDITQKALGSAESWLAANERMLSPATAVYTGMFIDPKFKYAADVEERNTQFQRQYLENQIKAMPDPVMNAVYQAVHQVGMAFIEGYTGGHTYQPINYQKPPESSFDRASYPQTQGPGGYSTAPNEGWGGYDAGSYMNGADSFGGGGMEGDFGAGFGGGMGGFG
jgi:hypothetical protein